MNDTLGLHQAWRLDGAGGGRSLTWTEIENHQAGDGLLWVDLDFSQDAARRWLSSLDDLPDLAKDNLLADETRPNTLQFGDGLLLILRGVNLNEGARTEDMISIRMWIDQNRIITCWRRELQSVHAIHRQLAQGSGPRSAGELVATLAGELATRIRHVVLDMEDALSTFEAEEEEPIQMAESIYSDLRRRTAVLRRHLNPQRDAMLRLQNYPGNLIGAAERDDLQIHTDAIIHSVEDLEVLREHTQALQDELFSANARGQNERMYMLTIVAAVFLPLTFISGLLGMNVGGIPLATSPMGFWGIVLICIVIVGFMMIYFRRKRWL